MSFDCFRNYGRSPAQEPGDIFKGSALIQFIFAIDTVFESKKFLVTGNIFTHHVPSSTAVRRRDIHTMGEVEVKISF